MIALRAPALLVALALTGALCAPVGVRASVGSSDAMQIVAGTRLTALADRAVSAAFTISDQRVPSGAVTVEPGGAPYVSSTYVGVPVAIRVDGTVVRTVVAGFHVITYIETAVAAHDLAPGSLISAEDLTLTRVAATGRPAVGRDVLFGRRLNLAVAKGVPVYVEETSPDRVVRAGQAAILVIHDGPVSLMADVIARTGGAIGDTVTVINLQTQRAVAGIVTGPNRVELTLPGGE